MPRFDCPIKGHKGGVTFPDVFTGEHYRQWTEALQKQDGDANDGRFQTEAKWRAVLVLGAVDVAGLPESLEFEAMPFAVVRWAVDVLDEWLSDFLPPRAWESQPGDGATDEA